MNGSVGVKKNEEMVRRGRTHAGMEEEGSPCFSLREGRRGVFGWGEIRVVFDNYSLNLS